MATWKSWVSPDYGAAGGAAKGLQRSTSMLSSAARDSPRLDVPVGAAPQMEIAEYPFPELHRSHSSSASSSGNGTPSSSGSYSARMPGEGYPFPRTQMAGGKSSHPRSARSVASSTRTPPSPPPTPAVPPVDMLVFSQLLELDDNGPGSEKFGFSKSLVESFFDDAGAKAKDITRAGDLGDPKTVAALAHSLRGSAAALGLHEVAHSCEIIESLVSPLRLEPPSSANPHIGVVVHSTEFDRALREVWAAQKRGSDWFADWFAERGATLRKA